MKNIVRSCCLAILIATGVLPTRSFAEGLMTKRDENDKSPSKDQIMWTETDVGYDLEMDYSFVGA